MTFSKALELLKEGKKVSREGWHLQGMWLEIQKPDIYSKMSEPYIYINIYGDIIRKCPWVASQTDLLADDWFAVR